MYKACIKGRTEIVIYRNLAFVKSEMFSWNYLQ